MAPTVSVDARSADRINGSHSADLLSDSFNVFVSLCDADNSCETYFSCRDSTPSVRSVIPEPSDAFMEVMGNMRRESGSSTVTGQQPADQVKVTQTPADRAKVRQQLPVPDKTRQTTPGGATYLTPPESEGVKAKSRRPASFGGADLVKPRQGRRASHCDKRVTWADEKGPHQLFSVRLIRPRLSVDTDTRLSGTPGQSILRNAGTS
ncbi:uncharacterized protein LOC131941605 [Physella acuta]|uniref:uncharacterized protein LOC131941605 n=1 Tax=Physella acuta TaxID=109671 RepID=UPI0027DB1A40|nr:uncharacterized protein LOC131941605 [Physella acuta]